MKTFREIRNLQEALTSRYVAGDKLWKSTGGRGDYPDLGKVNHDPTKKFHSVGKPVVVHAIVDGEHEDIVYYSDGKYVLAVAGHKQVGDARGSSDNAMMYMVDAGGGFNPAELKTFAMKDAKKYMDRVLRISDKVRDFSKEDEGSDTAPKSIKRMPFKESVDIKEGKLSNEIIRRHFSNVWALSAKEPKILDMFHKAVDTSNFRKKVQAYRKMTVGVFVRDELNGGYLDPRIIKKLKLTGQQSSTYKDLYYEKSIQALRGKLNNLKEANFSFVDMDKKSKETVLKLAKKHGLKVKEKKKGNLTDIDLQGPNNKMGKFMEQLPQDALEDVQERNLHISRLIKKHGRELKKVIRTGNLDLSDKAEEDLMTWAMNNGEVSTDDPDEFSQWLDDNIEDLVGGKIK